MCFAPWVSLTTALIEFLVAIFIFLHYRKCFLNRGMVAFVSALGLYQLTQFFLCGSNNPNFWALFGFIVYTSLPSLGLYMGLRYTHHRPRIYLIFLVPLAFILFAILTPNFIISAQCNSVFVMVQTLLFPLSEYWILSILYWIVYYFGFVTYTLSLVYKKYNKDTNKLIREEDEFLCVAMAISLLGAIVFILSLPALYITFPSVYCQISLIFAICAVIIAEIDKRKNRKR